MRVVACADQLIRIDHPADGRRLLPRDLTKQALHDVPLHFESTAFRTDLSRLMKGPYILFLRRLACYDAITCSADDRWNRACHRVYRARAPMDSRRISFLRAREAQHSSVASASLYAWLQR